MKALVLYGDYDLRYEDIDEPELKSGCVKIKICACGVCGSDIPRITSGGAHYYPIILGHEFSGYIEEVADDVNSIKVGDHVVAAPLIPCMECKDCRQGNYSLCKHYTFIGSRIQGGYADYVVLPARNVVTIDQRIPYEQAAFFEPATVALHGLKLAKYQGGGSVAILGGGTIGVFALQWAKIMGASNITVFGRNKEHLELSKRLGADCVISTLDEDYLEQCQRVTSGRGFDYVFETAGSVATMKLAFKIAGNHASICMIGTPTKDITFTPREWEDMNRKEFVLTGSWMSGSAPFPGDEWEFTAKCFSDGRLKFDENMIYERVGFSNPSRVTEILRDKEKVKGRILLINY